VSRGSSGATRSPPLAIAIVQPTEPSILESAARISSAAGRSSSNPPWLRGISIRKTPIALRALTRPGGMRRDASMSPARDLISDASLRMPANKRVAGRMPERGVSMLQRSVVKCGTCDFIVLSFLSSPTQCACHWATTQGVGRDIGSTRRGERRDVDVTKR